MVRNTDLRPVFVLNLRRSDSLAQHNTMEFCSLPRQVEGMDFLVIDKTRERWAVDACQKGNPNVTVAALPHDQSYWKSHASIPWTNWSWVIVAHDDDSWVGVPTPPAALDEVFAVLPTKGSHEEAEKGSPHVALFFGAIRADIYDTFCQFAASGPELYAGMDSILTFWLRQLGIGPYLPDYEYRYDASNWSSWSTSKASHAQFAKDLGWGRYASVEAMRWTTYLDLLCSLNVFQRLATPSEWDSTVRLSLRNYPPFGPSRFRQVLRRLPKSCRANLVLTRGEPMISRLFKLASERQHLEDPIWRTLRAGPRGDSSVMDSCLAFVEDVYSFADSCSVGSALPLAGRADWWRSQLQLLEANMETMTNPPQMTNTNNQ